MKIKKVRSYFKKVDPVIHRVIINMEIEPLKALKGSTNDYFTKLCEDIIGQQLAGKAARTITGRFFDLLGKKKINPDLVLAASDQKLRDVGLSWAKVSYVKNLAEKTKSREVSLNKFHALDDQAVVAELVKVKGIGPWTAEMFLIFTLGREDVFSYGDLGLKKGFEKLYKLDTKTNFKKAEGIVNQWSPYKSYASLSLWKVTDGVGFWQKEK